MLSVSQSVPVNSVADISVTVRVTEMSVPIEKLIENIKLITGVNAVSIGG